MPKNNSTENNIHTFGGQAHDNSQNIRTDALLSSHTDTEEVLIVFFIKNAFITKLSLFVEKEVGSVTHIQLHLTLLWKLFLSQPWVPSPFISFVIQLLLQHNSQDPYELLMVTAW